MDGKTIKTPYQNQLAFPSLRMAFLVANEFNRQEKYLKTGEMPLLAMSRTAVDADIEGNLAVHLRTTVTEYLKTDTILFTDECFEEEHNKQAKPLISFFSDKFKLKLEPSTSIATPLVEINPNFEHWLNNLNNWQLIGLETMTIWMRSTISAVAAVESSFPTD